MSTIKVEAAYSAAPRERPAALAALAEDQWFERKSARIAPTDLADVLIGFANAEGGSVLIGMHKGSAENVGLVPQKVSAWRQAAMDFTVPTVRVSSRILDFIDGTRRGQFLVLDVPASSHVHVNRRDEAFLRVGDETRRLSFHERQELHFDKGDSTYESRELPDTDQADLDQELITEYADAFQLADPTRLLINRGLMTKGGTLTIAGALSFASHPQAWLPEASVRVLRYRGRERGAGARQQVVLDDRIDGPVQRVLGSAIDSIIDCLPSRRALGASGRFTRVSIIPRDAWLEGLVNAVVHRSYSIGGDHIRVEVFDDRVQIESPGRFPGVVDLTDPMHFTRFARNPRLARVCSDLDFGQELGEGIRRMYEEMRLAGLSDPMYRQTAGSVVLTLSSVAVDAALEARLPPSARDLARTIRERERASTGELVEATGRSRPVVLRELKALRDAGIIMWVGQSDHDPRAFWTLPST